MGKKVSIEINSRNYTLIASDGEGEMHLYRLGQYVDRKIAEINESYPRMSTTDSAVMAALNIADELLKLRDENVEAHKIIDENKMQEEEILDQDVDASKDVFIPAKIAAKINTEKTFKPKMKKIAAPKDAFIPRNKGGNRN